MVDRPRENPEKDGQTADSAARHEAMLCRENARDVSGAFKSETERVAGSLMSAKLPELIVDNGPSAKLDVLFASNRARLDADGSGSLTMTELVSAAQDASIKGSDAEMIAALMENYSKLDKLGDEDDGVSCEDIEAYMGGREWAILETTEGPLSLTLSLAKYMEKKFADLDKDKDGRVQTRQIAEYMDTLDKDSKEHMLLQHFMDHLDEILRADPIPGLGPPYRITKDAVGAWAKKELDGCEDFALVRSVEDAIVRAREGMKSATEGINRELFAHKDDPLKDIVPEAVVQGTADDCYFLAAVASLARQNPQAIRDMIRTNADGTFTVTFPGAPDEPITVSPPSDLELAWFARGSKHGTWSAVLEKAYGHYCDRSLTRRNPLGWGKTGMPQEGLGPGSATQAGMRILTGKTIDDDIWLTDESLHEKLSAAKKDRRMATAWIAFEAGQPLGLADGVDDESGLFRGHVYSILDYDPDRQMIQVRNPWGHNEVMDKNGEARDGVNDGTFWVSLAEFRKYFTGIAYEE